MVLSDSAAPPPPPSGKSVSKSVLFVNSAKVTFIRKLWHGKWSRQQLCPEGPLCHIKWLTTPVHSCSPLHTAHNNMKEMQRDVAISQGCIPQWTGKTGNQPTPKLQWVKLETHLRLFTQIMFMSSINTGPLCSELTCSTRRLWKS